MTLTNQHYFSSGLSLHSPIPFDNIKERKMLGWGKINSKSNASRTVSGIPIFEEESYLKNQNLGFTVPYTVNGQERNYYPDFLACIDDGRGPNDLLNLIIEVTGEEKKDKPVKTSTARTLWIPAINDHSGFRRWSFLEITDPWNAKNSIRKYLAQPINEATRS